MSALYRWLLKFLYKKYIFDAIREDSLLKLFHEKGSISRVDVCKFANERLIPNDTIGEDLTALLQDGYLSEGNTYGSNFSITTSGQIFLSKGGYTVQAKRSRQSIISFWVSIVALACSICALLFK
jgi:hypothetical protein